METIVRYFTDGEDPEDNPVVEESEDYLATLRRFIMSLPDDAP